MTISIHQPNYLPWIGFFRKIMYSDAFVFLDCVQFTKGGYQNRVKIKTPNGPLWLTQTVIKSKRGLQSTKDVEFNNPDFWIKKHLKSIEANYRSTKYFNQLFPKITEYYINYSGLLLSDFNIGLIKLMCRHMGFCEKVFYKSSELNIESSQTERLLAICKRIGGNEYLSGHGGKDYQTESVFKENNIKLKYIDNSYSNYKQSWGEFQRGMSIIDLCFNEGANSVKFLEL
jgi:hypothetical protein